MFFHWVWVNSLRDQNVLFARSSEICCIYLYFENRPFYFVKVMAVFGCNKQNLIHIYKWAAPSEFGTYRLCEQRMFRRACASAQSRQNLRCSLIQAESQEEPSDRKPDPWPLWMAGHAQLKFVLEDTNSLDGAQMRDNIASLKGACYRNLDNGCKARGLQWHLRRHGRSDGYAWLYYILEFNHFWVKYKEITAVFCVILINPRTI